MISSINFHCIVESFMSKNDFLSKYYLRFKPTILSFYKDEMMCVIRLLQKSDFNEQQSEYRNYKKIGGFYFYKYIFM